MNVAMILKMVPWKWVIEIAMEVVSMVVEDTDNELDDTIVDAFKNTLGKAEEAHPDQH